MSVSADCHRVDIDFDTILERMIPETPKRVAVTGAADDAVLHAVSRAYERRIAIPILFGEPDVIAGAAQKCRIDLSPFECIPASNADVALKAVAYVQEGKADILMKGMIPTANLLKAVLNKEKGLRTGRTLSHVGIIYSPILGRPLLLTDSAMVMYPDLATKVELIRNAVQVANGLGISQPTVAPIAAVEVVNPDMPATIDAAILTVMNRRGQITGCVVDGPLAMDLAISEEAAKHKGVASPAAGRADILLMHNIEAANSTVKTFTHAGNSIFGGVVMGAKAPIVLTSRSDSEQSKLYSIACAALII